MPPDSSPPCPPPYQPGEIVMINGFAHLGLQRVVSCSWGATPGSPIECWLCDCTDADAAPVVPSPTWRGPAAYLSRHVS